MKKIPLIFSFLLFLPALNAAPVPISDPSFEENSLTPGQSTNNLEPAWKETNGPGNDDGFEESLGNFSAQGSDHLGMIAGHSVWQDLSQTYQANTIYRLTVAYGNRTNTTAESNQSTFSLQSSDGVTFASDFENASHLNEGSFANSSTLILDTAANPAAVGKTIRLQLFAGGEGPSYFDDIRLDATPIAGGDFASVVNQPASNLSAQSATLNGEVTSVGAGDPTITFFYGQSDGGENAAAWANSASLASPQSGQVSLTANDLTPGREYFYAIRAVNNAGTSWASPAETFETPAMTPAVSQSAASDLTATSARVTATIINDGGDLPQVTLYYGTADGGTVAGAWSNSDSLGQVTDSEEEKITGLTPATSYFYRLSATNSAGTAWSSASGSFTTAAAAVATIRNREPSSLGSSSGSLRGEVIDDGGSPVTVTLYYGESNGGTNPADWDFSVNVGAEDGDFSRFVSDLSPSTNYFQNVRASNASGTSWADSVLGFTTAGDLGTQAVINEIHFDPRDETSREEFIELYNPGSSDLDLSGWSLTDAIDFIFPAGTTLPANGFLVVAEDPATLLEVYGAQALGPWTGNLRNRGEEIDLRNSSGEVHDQVDYDIGFPWPTGSRGGGGSMELTNAALDNNLGASWRLSGSAAPTSGEPGVFFGRNEGTWSYRKGTSEASDPVTAWREIAFAQDNSWLEGQGPIGFGDGDDLTVLTDMRNNYSSVYLRREFTVEPDMIPQQLKLELFVDDGAIIWINGVEVLRFSAPDGVVPFDGTGSSHEAVWEEFQLAGASGYLVGGTNVIAIHALNASTRSSDFSIDASLASSSSDGSDTTPTPGGFNSSASLIAAPAIRQVEHSPKAPLPDEEVVITAKITDPQGMGEVSLSYQIVDPGSYIRKSDPDYDTEWITLPMVDDGSGPDSSANDSIYSVALPANLQVHRRLMRYRITFEDAEGVGATVPYPDDNQSNFAYFVYDQAPGWNGSFTGNGVAQNFPAELTNSLPIYHIIANSTDVNNSQYSSGFDGRHMLGTLVYDGRVYDHIDFENRGEFSTYVSGKNKWRIHFNRTHRFKPKDNWGENYNRDWAKLNIQSISSPWVSMHRGMAGLDESLSMRLYGMAGIPSPRTHYFSLRVIDAIDEATTNQYTGDMWGLYLAMEQPGGSFLGDRDLADGNVYKIESNSGDKKEQGDTQVTSSADWNQFRTASNSSQTEQWWRDNMDMPGYYSMRSLNRYLGNVDIRIGANHYFYHEPTMDQWKVIPWDLDMMFIAETHQAGVISQQRSIQSHPALAIEFRNRAREILDLVADDESVDGGQIGQLLDEYTSMVNPAGEALTWADIDANMWNFHPRTRGNPNQASGQSNHKGNFYRTPYRDSRIGGQWNRTLESADHEGHVKFILDNLSDEFDGANWAPGNGVQAGYGFEYLTREARDTSIPEKPTLAYSGPAGFPANQLTFTSGAFDDPNGSGTFGKTRFRIAKILAPGRQGYVENTPRSYEIETISLSPDLDDAETTYTFNPGVIASGTTYRVRVQHEDDTGRTSHWSDAVEFVPGQPSIDVWKENLVISEVMYNPADPDASEAMVASNNDDYEFIELSNVSDSITLDLRPLAFTDGITFSFSEVSTSLAPGASVILAKNQAAFEARYGAGRPVIGSYPNSLSNGGEQVVLSYGQGDPIIDFTYGTDDPWPASADGGGYSMVLIDPESRPDHALASNWEAGAIINGSPGTPDPDGSRYDIFLATHFSPAELENLSISGPGADPDADGYSNLLEYALLGDPRAFAGELVDSGTVELNNQTYLTLTYRERVPNEDLTYTPQISNDLNAWKEGATEFTEMSRIDEGGDAALVTVRSLAPLSDQRATFARVLVRRAN